MSKLEFKGTKGEWEIQEINSRLETNIICGELRIAEVKHFDGEDFNDPTEKEGKANAKLIADAGNVRQQINCSLPELLEQRNDLLEALQETNDMVKIMLENNIGRGRNIGKTYLTNLWTKSQKAINKALK